jgi:REP element-mobilizing transposase RayT
MPQSLAEIYLHIVFSTKGRHPFLHDRAIREQVHNYLFGTCKNLGCPPLRVGGVEDHVHIACRLGKAISISNLIKELKRESSQWIKGLAPDLAGFYWQSGYGAFSISPGHVAELVAYIKRQEEHHKTETYQEELRRYCQIYGVELDERYAWD